MMTIDHNLNFFLALSDLWTCQEYLKGDFDGVCEKVIETLEKTTDFKDIRIYLSDEGNKTLHSYRSKGLEVQENSNFNNCKDLITELKKIRSITINEFKNHTLFENISSQHLTKINSGIFCGIRIGDQLIGSIFIGHIDPKYKWEVNLINFVSSLSDLLCSTWNVKKQQEHRIYLEQYKYAIDQGTMFASFDKDFCFTDCNQRLLDILSLKIEDLIGEFSLDYVTDESKELLKNEVIPNYLSQFKPWTGEITQIDSNGGFIPTLTTIVPVNKPDIHYITIHHNLSLLKETEIQLQLSSKLSTIGEISAQILHEVSNPLTIMKLSLEGIIRNLNKKKDEFNIDKVRLNLAKAYSASEKVIDIFESMKLILKGDHKSELAVFGLDKVVEDVKVLLSYKLDSKQVSLIKDYDINFELLCRPGPLGQVLLNLMNNSADAISNKEDKWIKLKATKTPQNYIIQIVDSGTSMTEELAKKIFTNLYSKKQEAGAGLGLGLSLCKKIIEDHGGEIKAGLDGIHTCFTITIPNQP